MENVVLLPVIEATYIDATCNYVMSKHRADTGL